MFILKYTRTQMCTHTYSEAHAHRTYVRIGEGTGARTDRQTDKVILLLYSLIWIAKKIGFFILANNAIGDEMPPYVAFHQGLHCLTNSIQNEKG